MNYRCDPLVCVCVRMRAFAIFIYQFGTHTHTLFHIFIAEKRLRARFALARIAPECVHVCACNRVFVCKVQSSEIFPTSMRAVLHALSAAHKTRSALTLPGFGRDLWMDWISSTLEQNAAALHLGELCRPTGAQRQCWTSGWGERKQNWGSLALLVCVCVRVWVEVKDLCSAPPPRVWSCVWLQVWHTVFTYPLPSLSSPQRRREWKESARLAAACTAARRRPWNIFAAAAAAAWAAARRRRAPSAAAARRPASSRCPHRRRPPATGWAWTLRRSKRCTSGSGCSSATSSSARGEWEDIFEGLHICIRVLLDLLNHSSVTRSWTNNRSSIDII